MQLFDITTADKAIDRAWNNRPIRLTDHGNGQFEVQGRHGNYTVNVAEVNGQIYYACNCPARVTCFHCIPVIAMVQRRISERNKVAA
jgi:isoprenylcysteine carboxyl methyltransferase (ICMT) family protein YpbQ